MNKCTLSCFVESFNYFFFFFLTSFLTEIFIFLFMNQFSSLNSMLQFKIIINNYTRLLLLLEKFKSMHEKPDTYVWQSDPTPTVSVHSAATWWLNCSLADMCIFKQLANQVIVFVSQQTHQVHISKRYEINIW